MKTSGVLRASLVVFFLGFAVQTHWAQSSGDWPVKRALDSFQRIGERWKAGETNLPLLSIQWFPDSFYVRFTKVDLNGVVRNGSFSSTGVKGWGPCGFTTNDVDSLRQMIDSLPAPPTGSIPVVRQILIHGLRNNSWFAAVYDRADIPSQIEVLCGKVCDNPTWIVPSVSTVETNVFVPGRDGWIHQFAVAADSPVAASTTGEGVQVWDLKNWRGFQMTNHYVAGWPALALSADGKTMVVSHYRYVLALNLPDMTERWVHQSGRDDGQWCCHLASIDGGESLAVALKDRVEMWSLRTGKFEALLATNDIPFGGSLKASRDGRVLLAQLGNGRVLVWDAGWGAAPKEISASGLMDISPDGRFAAFNGDSWRRVLTIYDLKSGTNTTLPFRGLYNGEGQRGAWSPDGKYLAIAANGAWPCLYDMTSWKPVLLWAVPPGGQAWSGGSAIFIGFASDGSLIARSDDRILRALKLPISPEVLKANLPE